MADTNECDEVRPICDRCRVRGLDCSYRAWSPKHLAQSRSESGTGSADTSTDSSSAASVETEPLNEIVSETELAHHYISHTANTFAMTSKDELQWESWCNVVPALAVTSRAVRSGMLALAACCIYHHASDVTDDQRADLLGVAYAHYNACLRESGPQLHKLDQGEQADAAVATARMLFAIGLAFCQIERRLGKSLADSECWAWLPLLRGVFVVLKRVESAGMLDETLLKGQDIAHEMRPQKPYVSYERRTGTPESSPTLEFLRQARIQSLFSLRNVLAESRGLICVDNYTEYRVAIDLLDEVMSYVTLFPRIQSFTRVVFVWPSQLSSEFSSMMIGDDKFALVIYAHWLMLTVLLEDLWIVGDMGRAGIFEVVALSGRWTSGEQALLELPRNLLSLSG